jgi:predicted transcriptional regulator
MTELTIQADDQLMAALRNLASKKAKTVEEIIRDALALYI